MSGGTFEYKQYQIEEIADQIERELARQGREKSQEELWCNDEYYKQYPQERFHQT